jgi:hypothetical protein
MSTRLQWAFMLSSLVVPSSVLTQDTELSKSPQAKPQSVVPAAVAAGVIAVGANAIEQSRIDASH